MEQMSITSLIANASLEVQIIMLILGIFSVISWSIIISKFITLNKIKRETVKFNQTYHANRNFSQLYSSLMNVKRCSTSQMFYEGLSEYNRLNKNGIKNKEDVLANIERSLAATVEDELNNYENKLSTLATFGSVSPYIGLLGTVWGIMNAFIGLGNAGQATLSTVAPGIAEALIATAIGLFVAIPAYMGFNKFSADVADIEKKMNKFGDELLNTISRQLSSSTMQD